jgi:hypothetical protein
MLNKNLETRKEIVISSGTKACDLYLCVIAINKYLNATTSRINQYKTFYNIKNRKKIRVFERKAHIRITVSALQEKYRKKTVDKI